MIHFQQNNYDSVMEAVKHNGRELRHASVELQNKYEIVMEAVKRDGHALYYASKKLQNNFEIVMKAVKQNGNALNDQKVLKGLKQESKNKNRK